MQIHIRPLHPVFVGEVTGVDFAAPAEAFPLQQLRQAIDRYGILVFRNERPPTDEQHVAFSRLFGPVEISSTLGTNLRQLVTHPALLEVGNLDPDGNIMPPDHRVMRYRKGDQFWHVDYSFMRNRATYSFLAAHEVPPEGGDTEFADMRAAYETLPDGLKETLEPLSAEHSIWHSRRLAGFADSTPEEVAARPPTRHRLAHIRPGSTRKSLYIASHASHIVDWPIELGRGLLQALMAHATQPQFVYRHQWRVGDMVMWDNLATLHRATEYETTTQRRDMRRATCREHAMETQQAA